MANSIKSQHIPGVSEFLAAGRRVTQCPPHASAYEKTDKRETFTANQGKAQPGDPALKHCQCGCLGNYTDHSMRAGESGRPSWVVV